MSHNVLLFYLRWPLYWNRSRELIVGTKEWTFYVHNYYPGQNENSDISTFLVLSNPFERQSRLQDGFMFCHHNNYLRKSNKHDKGLPPCDYLRIQRSLSVWPCRVQDISREVLVGVSRLLSNTGGGRTWPVSSLQLCGCLTVHPVERPKTFRGRSPYNDTLGAP